jgi:hypothetical protein
MFTKLLRSDLAKFSQDCDVAREFRNPVQIVCLGFGMGQ